MSGGHLFSRGAIATVGLAAACLVAGALPAAADSRAHTVQQILRDGTAVASAPGVTVTPRGGTPESTIRVGESIADGTRVDVPAHLVVVIVSSGNKSTITLE